MRAVLLSWMFYEKHQLDGGFQKNPPGVRQEVVVPGMAFEVDGAWIVGEGSGGGISVEACLSLDFMATEQCGLTWGCGKPRFP